MENLAAPEVQQISPSQTDNKSRFISSPLIILIVFIIGIVIGTIGGFGVNKYLVSQNLTAVPPSLVSETPDSLPIGLQFALKRDSQRLTDLSTIAEALKEYSDNNQGFFPDTISQDKRIIGTDDRDATISAVLVPEYLEAMPFDPSLGSPDYTGYEIYLSSDSSIILIAQSEANPGKYIYVVADLASDY